jgi:coenzyme F420-0:L-glutamate ligase / coenzyme F420-1:gamma-L-glutamate ligase
VFGAMFSVHALEGIPEIVAGDDLAALIGDAIEHGGSGLEPGDILAITSKIVSKAEGRTVRAPAREDAITAETVRVVATRAYPGGLTRIVENRLGLVLAAAGVDSSNTPYGTVLLLPRDPDATARHLAQALRDRFDVAIGVVITDTLGRPWRLGQTDAAIGAAGIRVLDDLRGSHDANGRSLEVTIRAVGDEIAAAADLVKGKADNLPVALIRGLGHFVVGLDAPGARSIVRDAEHDMFRQGSAEARAEGFAAGVDAGLAQAATRTPAADAR